jgi:Hint module
VVFVPHGPNNQRSLFTHISTAAGSSIKVTSNHVIPAGPCNSIVSPRLVYASEVRVGDCILTLSGKEAVSAVQIVQGEGLYTIVTGAEFLVVNGIVVSPFGANHEAAHLYYNIHRFLYTAAPGLLKWSWLISTNEVCLRHHRPIMILHLRFLVQLSIKTCFSLLYKQSGARDFSPYVRIRKMSGREGSLLSITTCHGVIHLIRFQLRSHFKIDRFFDAFYYCCTIEINCSRIAPFSPV